VATDSRLKSLFIALRLGIKVITKDNLLSVNTTQLYDNNDFNQQTEANKEIFPTICQAGSMLSEVQTWHNHIMVLHKCNTT